MRPEAASYVGPTVLPIPSYFHCTAPLYRLTEYSVKLWPVLALHAKYTVAPDTSGRPITLQPALVPGVEGKRHSSGFTPLRDTSRATKVLSAQPTSSMFPTRRASEGLLKGEEAGTPHVYDHRTEPEEVSSASTLALSVAVYMIPLLVSTQAEPWALPGMTRAQHTPGDALTLLTVGDFCTAQ